MNVAACRSTERPLNLAAGEPQGQATDLDLCRRPRPSYSNRHDEAQHSALHRVQPFEAREATPIPSHRLKTPAVAERLRTAGCLRPKTEAGLLRAAFPSDCDLEVALARREAGEPLEHILGWAEFAGVRVQLGPGVFVPRPRAEVLVKVAAGSLLVDLGCGSGAIAAAIKERLPESKVVATDLSPQAVDWARVNGARYGFEVYQGHWFEALPPGLKGRVDTVVAYLPHVPSSRMQAISEDHLRAEGAHTVAGGEDGLDALRAILPPVSQWLAPGGALVTLLAQEQLTAARCLVTEHRGGLTTCRGRDGDRVALVKF